MTFWEYDLETILEESPLAETLFYDPEGENVPFRAYVNAPRIEKAFDKGPGTPSGGAVVRETSATYVEGSLPKPLESGDAVRIVAGDYSVWKVLADGKGAATAYLRTAKP